MSQFGSFALTGQGLRLPEKQYIIAQDIARDYDYTATEIYRIDKKLVDSASPMYFEYLACTFRDQIRLTYDKLPVYTKELMDSADTWGRCILVMDGTGVGKAAFDLYNSIGLDPFYVCQTGGNSASGVRGRLAGGFASSQFGDLFGANVPKSDLYASLKSHLERGLIVNKTKRYADISKKQFEHFQVEVTKTRKMTYENDSPDVHDDFITCAMLACWTHDQMKSRQVGRPADNMPSRRRASYDFSPFDKEDSKIWRL